MARLRRDHTPGNTARMLGRDHANVVTSLGRPGPLGTHIHTPTKAGPDRALHMFTAHARVSKRHHTPTSLDIHSCAMIV